MTAALSLPSPFDLRGKTALVTGGAGLLGRRHGAALAQCGAVVVLADIDKAAARAAADAHERHLAVELDVTDETSVLRAREEVERSGLTVDILVNNAAIDPKVTETLGPINSSRVEVFAVKDWNDQIAVGLTGAFLCSRVFGGAMAERGKGVILNIASDLSVIAPDQRLYRVPGVSDEGQPVKPISYSVIKTGLIGMTRYLATYWAEKGVRVNALSPGGIFTNQPDEFVARLSSLIPLRRMARADEYMSAVQFLCSDASSYMTGQNIVMDGGRSVL
jgi:NAD(P)-dependent dehydrogenase (short-subunit alcohol dehydrogenase family)